MEGSSPYVFPGWREKAFGGDFLKFWMHGTKAGDLTYSFLRLDAPEQTTEQKFKVVIRFCHLLLLPDLLWLLTPLLYDNVYFNISVLVLFSNCCSHIFQAVSCILEKNSSQTHYLDVDYS